MKVELDFFGGNEFQNMQNKFMHTCDVFETGKQLASYETLVVTGKDISMDSLCKNIAEAYEQAGGYAVFVGIKKVSGRKPKIKYDTWFMKGVQTLSMPTKDGNLKWGLFRDILKQIGYDVETDEHMRVTSVILK